MRSTRQSRISPALTGDAGEPGHSSWLDVVYDLFGGIIEWRHLSTFTRRPRSATDAVMPRLSSRLRFLRQLWDLVRCPHEFRDEVRGNCHIGLTWGGAFRRILTGSHLWVPGGIRAGSLSSRSSMAFPPGVGEST